MNIKRRKKDFIDPEVQGTLTRRLICHWSLFLLAACCIAVALEWMLNPLMPLPETLSQVWYTYAPLLAVLVCLAPVFIYDAVRVSNRFTGPVFRLRQATRQLAEGKTPDPVKLRDSDFWRDLAEDFNRVVQRVNDRESRSVKPGTESA